MIWDSNLNPHAACMSPAPTPRICFAGSRWYVALYTYLCKGTTWQKGDAFLRSLVKDLRCTEGVYPTPKMLGPSYGQGVISVTLAQADIESFTICGGKFLPVMMRYVTQEA